MKSQDLFSLVRKLAPEEYQSSWDNSGLQVAGEAQDCRKAAVCLEPTPDMVGRCLEWGAQAIVTHHPLYMKPKAPVGGQYAEVLRMVMKAGAWLYAAHTSLDCRPDGPAFWLGSRLGLANARFVETAHAFTPMEVSFHAARPLTREQAELWADREGVHSVSQSAAGEVRVVVDRPVWPSLAATIEFGMDARPEYYVRALEAPRESVGFGQVGELPEPLAWGDFLAELAGLVDREVFTICGRAPEAVSTVAYCGGSGSSLIDAATRAGADVFITGDMKYHPAVESELCVVDVGHFALEEEMMRLFAAELGERVDESVEVRFFEGTEPMAFHICAR
ncbi:Nif3-like dinuclear metal center hexameric protein [Salidesulfovibrio onnuriiensis]|uniref:Nif3-like dinuclear metal center hexameric protein n=1 Tax=Salidesulfovibrio onnuriiensis TaxID=2583823 RepID=UPI0011C8E2F6|nr:Nif3-like dinuclear metal center hexameric protein [Salidesulfovibrio onnuriiensis]